MDFLRETKHFYDDRFPWSQGGGKTSFSDTLNIYMAKVELIKRHSLFPWLSGIPNPHQRQQLFWESFTAPLINVFTSVLCHCINTFVIFSSWCGTIIPQPVFVCNSGCWWSAKTDSANCFWPLKNCRAMQTFPLGGVKDSVKQICR